MKLKVPLNQIIEIFLFGNDCYCGDCNHFYINGYLQYENLTDAEALEMDKIFKECGAVLVEKRVVNYAMC
jgi:hypothetical protein